MDPYSRTPPPPLLTSKATRRLVAQRAQWSRPHRSHFVQRLPPYALGARTSKRGVPCGPRGSSPSCRASMAARCLVLLMLAMPILTDGGMPAAHRDVFSSLSQALAPDQPFHESSATYVHKVGQAYQTEVSLLQYTIDLSDEARLPSRAYLSDRHRSTPLNLSTVRTNPPAQR